MADNVIEENVIDKIQVKGKEYYFGIKYDSERNIINETYFRRDEMPQIEETIRNAQTATSEAEKVDATITDANVLEVTGRDGVKKSLELASQADAATIKEGLVGKFDKESVVQESGDAEDKVMSQKATTTAIATSISELDAYHTAYINSLNQFTTDIVEKEDAAILNSGVIANQKGSFYSKYIPVVGGAFISSNIQTKGGIFAYDKNKKFIGVITNWKYDNSIYSNYIGINVLADNCAYIRVSGEVANYSGMVLYVGNEIVSKKYNFGETFDLHFKYRNKKLVTIGDSITYQTNWQGRLCELTGMRWNRKEVRGADESVKTEGYGYILLSGELKDTDTYFEAVEGIEKTEETIVDGFGYAHPIWTDAEGNKYRQPCRMAEGGETVMPVRTTSIYSRASDSKYYKGDVIIVFAGTNDRTTYVDKYPTNGDLSTIQGVTNLKIDAEDTTNGTFEIYTLDETLQSTGDYSDVGVITGIQKYNYTFRACFRGLLKKVVDANPDAEIIVVGTYATMIKEYEYISRGYDYLAKVTNEVIAECAREFSCQYIDLMPLFGRYNADKYFSKSDGPVYVHPTSNGGKKIAEYIASMIM